MAESIAQDRIQPSLLDRLTDDDPGNPKETRDQRFFSANRLRQAVLRDLSWLLNASSFDATQDIRAYPHVASSVLNYGVPPLAGGLREHIRDSEFRANIATALARFEPRLLPHSIEITLAERQAVLDTMQFTVEADLWAEPAPQRMLMRTELDHDLNVIRMVEQGGGS
jgi:type VI secretion system protein ImpF